MNTQNDNTARVDMLKGDGYVSLKVYDGKGDYVITLGFGSQTDAEAVGWKLKDQEKKKEEPKAYTKQEIVDVLKNANVRVSKMGEQPNKLAAFDVVSEVAEKLGINKELLDNK